MKIKRNDIIWNYISTIISISVNFVMLPIIMYFLSADLIGIWGVFISINGIVVLLDFGFNPTFSRNITYAWSGSQSLTKTGVIISTSGSPNYSLMKDILYASRKTYFLISIISVTIMVLFGTPYIIFISDGIDSTTILISWFVYIIAIFFNMYYGYFGAYLRGVGAIKRLSQATILSKMIQILLTITLLYLGYNIIGVTFSYMISGLVFRFTSKYYFYKYQDIGFNLEIINSIVKKTKEIFDTIWHNAWRDGVVSLSNFFAGQASVIIASLYLTLSEVGIYSISIQLLTVLATVASALYSSFQPSIQSAYIRNDQKQLYYSISLTTVAFNIIYWGGLVLLILIGIPILNFFSQDLEVNVSFLLFFSVYFYLLKHHTLFASYISNMNFVPYMKSFLLAGILGIIITIILFEFFNLGLYSLIFGQLVSQLMYNNWHWPRVVIQSLETSYFKLHKSGIKHLIKMLIKEDKIH